VAGLRTYQPDLAELELNFKGGQLDVLSGRRRARPHYARRRRAVSERRLHLGVALLAAALSWPLASDLQPALGVDGDWQIALQLAVRQGLDFGPDVLFTYGPLGFLHYPLIVDAALARVAFAYTIAIHIGVCVVLLWGLRGSLRSLPLAALGTLLIASVIYDGAPIVIGFAAAAALVSGRVEERRVPLVAAGLGALAALELLAKLNAGITLLGLAVIAVACAPAERAGRRDAGGRLRVRAGARLARDRPVARSRG
jgi:hypothetical protein